MFPGHFSGFNVRWSKNCNLTNESFTVDILIEGLRKCDRILVKTDVHVGSTGEKKIFTFNETARCDMT